MDLQNERTVEVVDYKNMSSEELEQEYAEMQECIAIMCWDMRQQADEFDYMQVNALQSKCDKINQELVARGYWVI